MAIDSAFLQARIDALKLRIVAYEDAILALTEAGGVQSYTLDTGQSRQTVTRYDIGTLETTLEKLESRLAVLCGRLNGGNSITARPAW